MLHPMLVTDSVESAEFVDKPDAPTTRRWRRASTPPMRGRASRSSSPTLEVTDDYPGAYAPSDTDAFFDAYADASRAWADIAGEHGADAIVVGTMFSLLDGPDYTDAGPPCSTTPASAASAS